MSDRSVELLRHILAECDYIVSVITSQSDATQLEADQTLKRAVVRSLEVIGEASKKVSPEMKAQWGEVAWKQMAGMRDRLIHDYMGINYRIVWDVACNFIPGIREQIRTIIRSEK